MALSEAIPIATTAWVSPRLNPSYEKRFGVVGKTAISASHRQARTPPRPSAGARHVYARRHFLIDEDSRAIAKVDQYDNRGELRRV